MFGNTLPDIHSDPTSALLSILKKFEGVRNHLTNPDGKKEARDYIVESFRKYYLHVWIERAKIGKVSEYSWIDLILYLPDFLSVNKLNPHFYFSYRIYMLTI